MEARYKRTWEVIYPPVDVDKFKYLDRGDFFLSVQRITPDKRVEIQIEAFKKLQDEKLIIVGSSCNNKYLAKLKRGAPKNVEFRINVSEEELIELYAKCKATIQTSKGEHFGLVPVESMASGKPCIAVNEGGFRETIIDQKTGILINEPYVDNLIKVIREIDSYHFDPKALVKHAQRFSLERFVDEFKRVIDETLRRSEHSKNN
ncbi:MAG: glycosyltransferase [Leptospiraceae bacterium]|nr:glycosyltransferase [Leptospiraceae bacterium]